MADLTPYARKKIEDFTQAAKNWGYMEDSGSGPDVHTTYETFAAAKTELENYVSGLIKKTKKKS
jgi:hypothetical protein